MMTKEEIGWGLGAGVVRANLDKLTREGEDV